MKKNPMHPFTPLGLLVGYIIIYLALAFCLWDILFITKVADWEGQWRMALLVMGSCGAGLISIAITAVTDKEL